MSLVGALAAALATYLACLALLGARLPLPAPDRVPLRGLVLSVGAAVAGALVAASVGMPLVGVAAGLAPWWWRARRRAAARERAEDSVVPVLDVLVGASRAGLVLTDALAHAVPHAREELARRLEDALARIRLGDAPAGALDGSREGASARVADLLAHLAYCARTRLAADATAAYLEDVLAARRFARQLAADVRARTAGQRFQVLLLAAVVPALALYLGVMSPTLAAELASPLGRGVLVPAGLAFELAGIVVSRRVLAKVRD